MMMMRGETHEREGERARESEILCRRLSGADVMRDKGLVSPRRALIRLGLWSAWDDGHLIWGGFILGVLRAAGPLARPLHQYLVACRETSGRHLGQEPRAGAWPAAACMYVCTSYFVHTSYYKDQTELGGNKTKLSRKQAVITGEARHMHTYYIQYVTYEVQPGKR